VLDRDGHIDGPLPAQELDLPGREQLPHQGVHLGMGPLDGAVLLNLAVFAVHHRVRAGDVDVRDPLAHRRGDDAGESFHSFPRGPGFSG